MRGLKEFVYGVYFEELFIFNLHIYSVSVEKSYEDALKQIRQRYPVKHRKVELSTPYELPIADYVEPAGQIVKIPTSERIEYIMKPAPLRLVK